MQRRDDDHQDDYDDFDFGRSEDVNEALWTLGIGAVILAVLGAGIYAAVML